MKSILLIDSETEVAAGVHSTLVKFGFYVEIATSNRAVHDRVDHEEFDLILLEFNLERGIEEDPNLPASAFGRGLGLIRELRARAVTTPIVVYSVLEGDAYETASIDAGADDYLVRRIPLSTLLCRLNAQVRRRELDLGTRSRPDRRARVGELILDRRTKTLTTGNSIVSLTDAEMKLVAKLAAAPSRIVPVQELVEDLWGGSTKFHREDVASVVKELLHKTRKLRVGEMVEASGEEGYLLSPSIRFPRPHDPL